MTNILLRIGGLSAESYNVIIGGVLEKRAQSRFFSWIGEQMGRYYEAGQLNEFVDSAVNIKTKIDESSDFEMINYLVNNIPGIGYRRANILIQKFGSLENIGQATLAEISSIKGISKKTAISLVEHFQKWYE